MRVLQFKSAVLAVMLIALSLARQAAAELTTVAIAANPSCQVTLTWEPSPDTNAVGYFLYYWTDSGVTNRVDVGNQSTLRLTGLESGELYQFAVTAYDANGFESEPSNEVQYTSPTPQLLAAQVPSPQTHTLNVQFQAAAGGAYRIEASADLLNWTTVVTTNISSSGPISIPIADTTATPAQFFRMVQDH